MTNRLIIALPSDLEKIVKNTLNQDEQVLIKLKGAFKEALICTDRRILIIKSGFMTGQLFGSNIFQLPYKNITSAEVKYHLISGYFELSSGGVQNTPKSYWDQSKNNPQQAPNCISLTDREVADKFREATTFILNKITGSTSSEKHPATQSSSDEILNSIERLGKLAGAGIITSEEFELKKKELLDRL